MGYRGGVRLDEDNRWTAQDPLSRHAAGRLDVHAVGGGLRPDPAAEAAGWRGVVAPGVCSLRGRQPKFHRPARQNLSELPLMVHYQPASAAENSGNSNRSGVFPQPANASTTRAREEQPVGKCLIQCTLMITP